MKCIVRQQVDLYGTVYRVGLRDIPAGHACGDYFDKCVASGWISIQQTNAKPAVVVAVVDDVDEVSDDVIEAADGEPVDDVVQEKPKRQRKTKVVE